MTLDLRPGDRVRLTGPSWADYGGVSIGDVVNVDAIRNGGWSNTAGALTTADGGLLVDDGHYDYSVEVVSRASDWLEPKPESLHLSGPAPDLETSDLPTLGDLQEDFEEAAAVISGWVAHLTGEGFTGKQARKIVTAVVLNAYRTHLNIKEN